MDNKEKLIEEFEEKELNEEIDDALKYYNENGLISSLEKTEDEKFLLIGNENLGIFIKIVNF